MEETLAGAVEAARRDTALLFDGAVSAGAFNFSLADLLARAGPFGAGNPEPMLALPAHTLAYADPVGDSHIRARFRSGDGKFVNAIAFRAMGQPLGRSFWKTAAMRCMPRATSQSTAGRARNAFSCGWWMSPWSKPR